MSDIQPIDSMQNAVNQLQLNSMFTTNAQDNLQQLINLIISATLARVMNPMR